MPYDDLRSFIDRLYKDGEIIDVKFEVDCKHEIGAICRKALWTGGIERNKGLLFRKIKGFDTPLAANLIDSTRRYFMALDLPCDTSRPSFAEIWEKRISNPIKPKLVDYGPCKENILKGNEVDVSKFPIPIWNEKDGGPYITLPCVITRDLHTGALNAGIYRSQVFNRNTIGLLAAPYRHPMLGASALKAGDKFPVAMVIGCDPSIYIAAAAPLPYGTDEIDVAGGLRGAPIEMVRCETIPLEVPATSEIVIEGEMTVGKMMHEGPFGEFTGYYGEEGKRPFLEIKAITHRNNAIFQGCYEGRPNTCDSVLQILAHEAEVKRKLEGEHKPFVKAISIPHYGAMMIAVASIRKQYDGQAKVIGQAIVSSFPTARWIKILILVDEDIDPYNIEEVLWAVATRSNFEQDLELIRNVTGNSLDPSMPLREKENRTLRHCKIIIDATKPVRNDPEKPIPKECMPKKEIWDRIEDLWTKCTTQSISATEP